MKIMKKDSDYDTRPADAQRLEEARRARGFDTAVEATRYFGWVYESYTQHENGLRGLKKVAAKYAKAFRVSEGWLLTGEGGGPGGQSEKSIDAKMQLLTPEDYAEVYEDFTAIIDRRIEKRGKVQN